MILSCSGRRRNGGRRDAIAPSALIALERGRVEWGGRLDALAEELAVPAIVYAALLVGVRLADRHPESTRLPGQAIRILEVEPHNVNRRHRLFKPETAVRASMTDPTIA